MATDEEDCLTERDFASHYGNDTPSLMASVPEPPPSHWGVTTSQARTASVEYLAFLNRHREGRKNG